MLRSREKPDPEKVAAHYKAGVSTREIKRRHHISTRGLHKILADLGVPRRKPKEPAPT
jgi:hypothetical protein